MILFGVIAACNPEMGSGRIDRKNLATRNNVRLTEPDTLNSLSVGNGEFAFTVDVTGLQTYPEYYERGMALGSQSQWAWHTVPTDQGYALEETMIGTTSCEGREISFPVQRPEGRKEEATRWLRSNPHRLHLGIIGLILLKENGDQAEITDLKNIDQELDLWTGTITSRYEIEGIPVTVELVAHQEKDQVSARIKSRLINADRLRIRFRFPYGAECHVCPGYDWNKPEKHATTFSQQGPNALEFHRRLDTTNYFVAVNWNETGEMTQNDAHDFELTPSGNGDTFEFNVLFSARAGVPADDFGTTQKNSKNGWKTFWTEGAAIDFSACTDPRARELERRVVLSQYLTRIQCAGSLPPQETGLTMNSWFGKFHLEMHWWHGVHFPLWNRKDLLERSLDWYKTAMVKAKATAQRQGYQGARWQKMTNPSGDESPSSVGPYLVWQQPHVIYFAELLYRQDSSRRTLDQYKDLVFETAEFMTSLPVPDPADGKYHLCRPLIPAQEVFPASGTDDPSFELAYWHYGLSVACEWRQRLGLPEKAQWKEVLDNLAPLPVKEGLYLPTATAPMAYSDNFYRRDHPAVLGAYGFLPRGSMIDTAMMARTFNEILREWAWESTWGWDYPMMAMTASRLNMPDKAIDVLFMDTQKNTYLKNGHNYQDERLRLYLPGNGGLLTAVAMMAAGWDGSSQRPNPGFPGNGQWNVKWERLHKMP